MTGSSTFVTPHQAVVALAEAGALFRVRARQDLLGNSFTVIVANGGDFELCSEILASVMRRPASFYRSFRAAVQDAAQTSVRGEAGSRGAS